MAKAPTWPRAQHNDDTRSPVDVGEVGGPEPYGGDEGERHVMDLVVGLACDKKHREDPPRMS
jgi:hypothetical protein